jgi:phosphoribosyl-ATP pyrophosphohydrolase/phosphoribosyl-AMP cyclohydrolase
MLGYMNEKAYDLTRESGKVVFFSRSRQTLWRKGETSGHELEVVGVHLDCDQDTVLLRVNPKGPVCHTGDATCFHDDPGRDGRFLDRLQDIVRDRIASNDPNSYTWKLVSEGSKRLAQKVGEEGVETALAAISGTDGDLLEESADLLFHLIVLLQSRGLDLGAVEGILAERHVRR